MVFVAEMISGKELIFGTLNVTKRHRTALHCRQAELAASVTALLTPALFNCVRKHILYIRFFLFSSALREAVPRLLRLTSVYTG